MWACLSFLASDAVLPGVALTITHQASGQERQLSTDSNGNYVAAALPVGEYTIRAVLPTDHQSPSGPETHCIAQQHAVVSAQFLTAVDLLGLPESELDVGRSGPVERFTPVELSFLSSPKPVPLVLRI